MALSLLVRDQDAEPVRVLADGIRVECLANGTAVTMRKNLATHREYGRAAYPTGESLGEEKGSLVIGPPVTGVLLTSRRSCVSEPAVATTSNKKAPTRGLFESG